MPEIVWCAINPDLSNGIQLDSNYKAHVSTIIQSNHWATTQARDKEPKIFLNVENRLITQINWNCL